MRDGTTSIRQALQQTPSPEEAPLSRLYHEASKVTHAKLEEIAWRFEQIHAEGLGGELYNSYKSYPGLPQVPLPRARLVLERDLQRVIAGRRSVRSFDAHRPVTLQELANMLQLTYGITERLEDGGLVGDAAFHLVVSAVFARTQTKYRERGYRFVLLEAGEVGYSATLLGECQGIHSCMAGGWMDAEVERLLGLDGYNESVVHVVCFGRATP